VLHRRIILQQGNRSGFFMEYIVIILVAFGASMLTFFSGFGLGTMLTPVFILFFPPEFAVAATAIVHFLNNMFKLVLIGKHAVRSIIIRFGLPAIVGAYFGALALSELAHSETVLHIGSIETNYLNVVMAVLIFLFSLMELLPGLKNLEINKKFLLPGGIFSGFFGGLSGHQGALRSAFLVKLGLNKSQFVATGVVIACLIDTIRIGTYAFSFDFSVLRSSIELIGLATLSAFAGAFIGKNLLEKITISFIQNLVGFLMILISILLFLGII
jgi:uncharacterized membrane protein YfcA